MLESFLIPGNHVASPTEPPRTGRVWVMFIQKLESTLKEFPHSKQWGHLLIFLRDKGEVQEHINTAKSTQVYKRTVLGMILIYFDSLP